MVKTKKEKSKNANENDSEACLRPSAQKHLFCMAIQGLKTERNKWANIKVNVIQTKVGTKRESIIILSTKTKHQPLFCKNACFVRILMFSHVFMT